MQIVYINDDKYQYDIHSLYKAFYPGQDVKVILRDENAGDAEKKDVSPSDEISFIDVQKSKNDLKKGIYQSLSEKTGKVLPWGDLTGIRPTRIAMNLLDEGKSPEEVSDYMKETYLVSDEKTKLALDIARRERNVLSGFDYKAGYSLYIGIPFCPTTCLYCSFTSYPIGAHKSIVDDYITCIEKEIDYVAQDFGNRALNSVYIGGGTPTTLEPDQLRRLIGFLRNKLDLKNTLEFTVEAGRPDSITADKLKAMKEMGVTRISVNPQTMNDKTLKLIGRRHSVAELKNAFSLARDTGFDNINMDIILGLPGENEDSVRYTIEEIKKLSPDDLTVHSLALKRGSRLYEAMRERELRGELSVSLYDSMNNTPEMMKIAADGASDMGLSPYYLYRQKNISGNFENTGYARDGKEGIYNILINEEVQSIVALGAGTVTKRVYNEGGRIERCDNVKDIRLYMDSIDEMIERKKKLFS